MRRESSEELARAARARLDALVRHWPPVAGVPDPAEVPDVPEPVRGEREGGSRPGRHAADLPGRGSVERAVALVPQQRARLLLALVVALVAALIAGWSAWRSAPRPVPVAARSTPAVARTTGGVPMAGSSGTPPAAIASAGTPARVVVVDVAGKVRHPGIATLPAGARVVDALRRAGGARAGVDLSSLNLARVLVDGEQILVGVAPPAGAAAPAAPAGSVARSGPTSATGALVNLNTATAADLEGLPGVGPVTAQKIVAWRTAHGSFTAIDELLEVPGIGPKTLAEIAPGVTL